MLLQFDRIYQLNILLIYVYKRCGLWYWCDLIAFKISFFTADTVAYQALSKNSLVAVMARYVVRAELHLSCDVLGEGA